MNTKETYRAGEFLVAESEIRVYPYRFSNRRTQ
jgi:hypothetical protein